MSKVIGITVGTTYDKNKLSGSGLTEDQKALLEKLSKWYEDQNYTKMTVTMSPPGGTYELGSSVDIEFSWEFTEEVSSVTFNGESQPATKKGSIEVTGITSSSSYEVIGIRADGDHDKASAKSNINFLNRFYRGYAKDPRDTNAPINSEFIKKLGTKGFADTRGRTFPANCPSGQYIWYAYPERFGEAQTSMAPAGSTVYFSGGFESPISVNVTNSSGYTEKYYVYRSINTGLHQEIKFT